MNVLGRLLDSVKDACANFTDKRRTTQNQVYSMADIGLSAFSMFFTQCESFLAYQRTFAQDGSSTNCETLFGVEKIPTDNHIRSMLDEVTPEELDVCFVQAIAELTRAKGKNTYKHTLSQFGDRTLITLDGTEYFQSNKISCDRCLTRKLSDDTQQCYHSMLAATIVAPGSNLAIPLMPEFIRNEDGQEKQDCEVNAAKRWFKKYAEIVKPLKPIFLGDALYASQPMIDAVFAVDEDEQFDFIFVCKPESNETLYQALETAQIHTRVIKAEKGQTRTIRWAKNLPMRQNDTTFVDWVEITITAASGKRTYKNAFITSLGVTADIAERIAACGRARWKCENEGFNILKNHGYNFEHNFGHGKQYLAQVFATMNLLAYAIHSLCDLMEEKWQQARKRFRKRITFFTRMDTLLEFFVFADWDMLIDALITKRIPPGAIQHLPA